MSCSFTNTISSFSKIFSIAIHCGQLRLFHLRVSYLGRGSIAIHCGQLRSLAFPSDAESATIRMLLQTARKCIPLLRNTNNDLPFVKKLQISCSFTNTISPFSKIFSIAIHCGQLRLFHLHVSYLGRGSIAIHCGQLRLFHLCVSYLGRGSIAIHFGQLRLFHLRVSYLGRGSIAIHCGNSRN